MSLIFLKEYFNINITINHMQTNNRKWKKPRVMIISLKDTKGGTEPGITELFDGSQI